MAKPASKRIPSYSESYKDMFFGVFPELVEELTADRLKNTEISDGLQHLKEVLEYNVMGGKCNRGLMVIGAMKHLISDRELTKEEENGALVLGWCVEWVQAFFLVADDIMDNSELRRGKPCWYRKVKPEVNTMMHAQSYNYCK